MATSKLKWFSPSTTTTSWIIERSKANQLCTRDLQDDVLQEEGFPHYQTLANGTCEAAQAELSRKQSTRSVRGRGLPPQ